MSDQQAPPQNGDTPAVAGPTEAPGTAQDQPQAEESYQKRYTDLQAEYTRSQQENAQLKQEREWAMAAITSDDPDIQRQAYDILGIEVPDEDDVDEGEFEEFAEEDPYDQRIRALEERLSSFNEEAQAAMEAELVANSAHAQLAELGMAEGQADDKTREIIFKHALSLPRLPPQPGGPREGALDIRSAYEELTSWGSEWAKAQAKARPRAPYVSPGGSAANEVPNSGTGHAARMERAMRSIHNNMGDE